MSRSKGRSSLHEARYTAQLIYLMISIGLPYVHHGGLRPCDGIYHHCICSFDVWEFPPALSNPVTDYTFARNVLMSACSCISQLCPFSEMMACFTRL